MNDTTDSDPGMDDAFEPAPAERTPLVPTTRRAQPVGAKQARLLASAITLEEAGPPRVFLWSLVLVCLLIGGAIVWAALTPFSEKVSALGEVVPAGSVHIVQHLEGGIVSQVLVRNSEIVEKGQAVMRLDPAVSKAELEQLRARQAALSLRAERLRAFVEERRANFSAFEDAYPSLVADQRYILTLANESVESQRLVLEGRIAQREGEIDILSRRRASLEVQAAIVEEELSMRSRLAERGLISRIVLLETQREHSRLSGEVSEIDATISHDRLLISEAINSLVEFDSRLRDEAINEMGDVTAELAQINEALVKLEDRVRRLEIAAPEKGVVNGLEITTIGAVIEPGATLMEIVPLDDEMIVEARISAQDIGHVTVGQEVDVKVITFDYARFGSITGALIGISANSFTDDDDVVYYKAEVRLKQNYVGNDPADKLVLPGMTVQAEIITGSKSVLRYLLKPIYASLGSAFSER